MTFTVPELFEGLQWEEFQFRNLDSIQNESCISLPWILDVPIGGHGVTPTPTTPKLALHINFNCKVSGLRKDDRLNLSITAFHFTARPVTGQLTIDEHGPSVLTARESIHINRNTGWGRPDNLQELLRKLNGPSMADLLSVLNYNIRSVPYMVKQCRAKIKLHVQYRTRIMNITFHNSDRTFPIDD